MRPRCTRVWACQSGRRHQAVDGVDVERAYTAGRSAALKLAGHIKKVEATPEPPREYAKRHFFVLILGKTGIFQGAYNEFRGYVTDSKALIWHGAIFHGFLTEAEAREYWRGAEQEQPWNSLEPRRFIAPNSP